MVARGPQVVAVLSKNIAQMEEEKESPFEPLKLPVFRWIWLATVVSNIGTWVHDTGAAWLMTDLAPSPLMVSLVQAATTAPVFLIGLPAGALADIVDRRKLLLYGQIGMLIATLGLTAMTFSGAINPALLLAFTAVLGFGTALCQPAWSATTPEIVPPELVPGAVTLQGLAINVARAVGPAIGGLLIASIGTWAAFGLNAVSFVGIIIVLLWWKPEPRESKLAAEGVLEAMGLGLRYIRHSKPIQRVLSRALMFIVPGSALWALMPLFARKTLSLSAGGYGALLGVVGLGAVIGVFFVPTLRKKLGASGMIAVASLVMAVVLAIFGYVRNPYVVFPLMLPVGFAWLTVLSTLNSCAQSAVPNWVRARALAVYLIIFFGGMAVGAPLWGTVASFVGTAASFPIAGVTLAVLSLLSLGISLPPISPEFHKKSNHWEHLTPISRETGAGRKAVVQVTYIVSPERVADFILKSAELRESRLSSGAVRWEMLRHTTDDDRFVEVFTVPSWEAHQQQHERVSKHDEEIQNEINESLKPGTKPVVDHFLSKKIEK